MSEACDILVVVPGKVLPVGGGGVARAWGLIRHFRSCGWKVHLVAGCHLPNDDARIRRMVDGFWPVPAKWTSVSSGDRSWLGGGAAELAGWALARPRLRAQPHEFLAARRDDLMEGYAAEVARLVEPRAVLASFVWNARLFRSIPASMLKVLDTIDVQSLRASNAREAGGCLDSYFCPPEEEAAELRHADILVAIQREEARELRRLCPDRAIVVAEHGTTTACSPPSAPASRDVLFVGNRYAPNVDGLKTFLECAWPRVRAAEPTARLVVCGAVSGAFANSRPDVHLHGVVPELDSFYDHCAVVINPTPYGTGLKIKSAEALARGKALVSTEAGFAGLPGAARQAALVVPSIADMVPPLLALLGDVQRRHAIEHAARDVAQQHFAPAVVYKDLTAAMARVLPSPARASEP